MYLEILKNLFGSKKPLKLEKEKLISKEDLETLERFKENVHKVFKRSLRIRQVDAGSCNACEWECTALNNPYYDIQRFGIDFVASPRHADALLVTGPISRQMLLALKKTFNATPSPKFVIACGDCAKDGGVYKDSYAVTNGVDKVVPVEVYIPGCPPSPTEIIKHILKFLEQIK